MVRIVLSCKINTNFYFILFFVFTPQCTIQMNQCKHAYCVSSTKSPISPRVSFNFTYFLFFHPNVYSWKFYIWKPLWERKRPSRLSPVCLPKIPWVLIKLSCLPTFGLWGAIQHQQMGAQMGTALQITLLRKNTLFSSESGISQREARKQLTNWHCCCQSCVRPYIMVQSFPTRGKSTALFLSCLNIKGGYSQGPGETT